MGYANWYSRYWVLLVVWYIICCNLRVPGMTSWLVLTIIDSIFSKPYSFFIPTFIGCIDFCTIFAMYQFDFRFTLVLSKIRDQCAFDYIYSFLTNIFNFQELFFNDLSLWTLRTSCAEMHAGQGSLDDVYLL